MTFIPPPRKKESSPDSSSWKKWLQSSLFNGTTAFQSKTKCENITTNLPPPPPSQEGTPPTEQVAPPPLESTTEGDKTTTIFPNPGVYDHAPMDIKRFTTLDTFDGFRCDINKSLSPFMQVVHSFWLGTSMIPDRNKTYTFITQVVNDNNQFMAHVDLERKSVNGKMHSTHLPVPALHPDSTFKVTLGVSEEGQQDQLLTELDLQGDTWTGNLKYGTMGGGLLFGGNYFQSVTPSIALGGEGMYIATNQAMVTSYLARYTSTTPSADPKSSPTPNATMMAQYSPAQGQLSLLYKKVVTPDRVTLGAELTCFPLLSSESTVSLGCEFQLLRSKMNVTVDGSGKICSLLEAKLGTVHGAPTMNFCGEIDFMKDSMKFGYGINISG